MPGLDMTGPLGKGKRSGRGLGVCDATKLTAEVSQMLPPTEDVDKIVCGLGRGGVPCGRRGRGNKFIRRFIK